jgi:pilus assembly protein CpaE
MVVSSLTIPAIKDAKLTLKVLESLAVAPGALSLVINRTDPYSEFNKESIERNLLCPVTVQLPYDGETTGDAITRGTPFVVTHPDSELSLGIRQLVHILVPATLQPGRAVQGADPVKHKARRGIFSR